MSFLDKVMFWKKGDDELSSELDFGSTGPSERGFRDSNLTADNDPFKRGVPGESHDPFGGDRNNTFYDKPMNESNPFESSALQDQNSYNQDMNQNRGFHEELRDPQQMNQNNQNNFNNNQNNQNNDIINQTIQKDLEIISNKIDYIRAVTDNINQRLTALERLAREDGRQQPNQNPNGQNPRKPW